MKKIYRNKVLNIPNTDYFDATFLFEILVEKKFPQNVEIFFMNTLLEQKKNEKIFPKLSKFPSMWSEVYSPKDELEIFTSLFENALKNKKKIHIVGVTLDEEIKMLETYYECLGFMRKDINCFSVDFSIPLVTVSCYVENIMWKGSDYKRLGEKIFRNPPIREAGQVKALYKGINRGVIAGLEMGNDNREEVIRFLEQEILSEHIFPLTLGKVLRYNLEDLGIHGNILELPIGYKRLP